jgi:hypothetical protein
MKDSLDRRQFTVAAALALLGGASITISACGGGSSPSTPSNPNPSPNLNPGDKAGTVGTNHGHTAVLTAAQLSAGGGVTLDIAGSGGHPHIVTLTGPEIVSIAGGTRVSKESTNVEAHTHTVTFN